MEVILTDLARVQIPREIIHRVADRRLWNEHLAGFYERLAWEDGRESFVHVDAAGNEHVIARSDLVQQDWQKRASQIRSCNEFWDVDYYRSLGVKDVRSVVLCKDKFCFNCKTVKQAVLMARFEPYLRQYADQLYHVVLTVPNVSGVNLKAMVKKVNQKCGYLFRLFRGNSKVAGLDFSRYGITGGLRSLEITYAGDNYHPHLHVALVMSGSLGSQKHLNVYSRDHRGERDLRPFTDFEIVLQKIWRLLIDGQRLTADAIAQLDLGYSVTVDKFRDDDFRELFKYMTKVKSGNMLTFPEFQVLFDATWQVRQVQGYGCLFKIRDDDLDQDLAKEVMEEVRAWLRSMEEPERWKESPAELAKFGGMVISLKAVVGFIREIEKDSHDSESVLLALGACQ